MVFHLYGSLFCLAAYLLGSIPFGLVASWIFGIRDPRLGGSGNLGFTNVLRLSGIKTGIFTLTGDLGKGWIIGAIASTFFYDNTWGLFGLIGVVLGHIFPVFLKFQGGKGVATGLGGILGFDFELGSILVIIWLSVVGLWKYSSGGALISFTVLPIASWLMGQPIEFLVFSIVLSGTIIVKHKGNIQRLINGTESRIGSQVQ